MCNIFRVFFVYSVSFRLVVDFYMILMDLVCQIRTTTDAQTESKWIRICNTNRNIRTFAQFKLYIFFALFLLLLLLSSIFFWHFLFLVSSFYLSHPLFVPCSRWNDKEMFIEMERHIKTEKNTTKTLFAADMESVKRNNNKKIN